MSVLPESTLETAQNVFFFFSDDLCHWIQSEKSHFNSQKKQQLWGQPFS